MDENTDDLLREALRLLRSLTAPDGYGPGVPWPSDEIAARGLADRIEQALAQGAQR